MHVPLLLTIFSNLLMASSPAARDPGSRDIWQYPPHEEPSIKYYSVPNDYDDLSLKHADLIGSHHGYKDGQVWLVMKGQRLFRTADDLNFQPPPTKYASDVEIMGPAKLKEVLKKYPPYEQMHAEYLDLYARREAAKLENRQSFRCENSVCEDESECRAHSRTTGACDNCHGICHWYSAGLPN